MYIGISARQVPVAQLGNQPGHLSYTLIYIKSSASQAKLKLK